MPRWIFEPVTTGAVALRYRDRRNGIDYHCGQTRRGFDLHKALADFIVLHADPFDTLHCPDGLVLAFLPKAKETA